jgi:chromosome segregation ATPase
MEEEDLKSLKEKCAALQVLYTSATVSKQELEVKFRDLETRYREHVLQHEQDLKDSKEDIDYLTQENKDLRNSNSILKDSCQTTELNEKLSSLANLYEKNLATLASQESYINQIESQNLSLSDQVEKLTQTNLSLDDKKKRLTDENNILRNKNKELKETMEKVTKEAEKVIFDHVKREESRKNQQDEYMSVVKKHSTLTKKYQDLLNNYEKLEKELASKNERISSIRNSKSLNDSKLKEEEKKNEELTKKLKSLENSLKFQRKLDLNESISLEYEAKLSESERKLEYLAEKLDPLLKRNQQLEKLIEKQNIQISHLKGIQKDLNSTVTFLNLELEDYRKEGTSIISPKPNIRKSQLMAFQSSSGYAKQYKMDPSRFSPLKPDFPEMESPNLEVPSPTEKEDFNTSEFSPNI